jgi:hypothetical protein
MDKVKKTKEISAAPKKVFDLGSYQIRFRMKAKVIGADKNLRKIYLIEN